MACPELFDGESLASWGNGGFAAQHFSHGVPQTFTESQFWRHQLATAADNLRDETLRWGAPIPRCTGEEMVLYLILQRAQKASRSPNQWYNLFEILFQDEDVLMLYHMPPEAAESIADAVNLAPKRWFTEFTVPFLVPDR